MCIAGSRGSWEKADSDGTVAKSKRFRADEKRYIFFLTGNRIED
ncbi:hypothetical protein WCP94_001348 [Bilophila wadsworthia]